MPTWRVCGRSRSRPQGEVVQGCPPDQKAERPEATVFCDGRRTGDCHHAGPFVFCAPGWTTAGEDGGGNENWRVRAHGYEDSVITRWTNSTDRFDWAIGKHVEPGKAATLESFRGTAQGEEQIEKTTPYQGGNIRRIFLPSRCRMDQERNHTITISELARHCP